MSKSKKPKKGRPPLSAGLAGSDIESSVFIGTFGDRVVTEDSLAWISAVNCARHLHHVSAQHTDDKSDLSLAAIRARFSPVKLALGHIGREIRAGRGPQLFRFLAEAFGSGLEKPNSVLSWRADVFQAWGEASMSKKGGRPFLTAVQKRLKLRGHDVDKRTLGKFLGRLNLGVSPQGVRRISKTH